MHVYMAAALDRKRTHPGATSPAARARCTVHDTSSRNPSRLPLRATKRWALQLGFLALACVVKSRRALAGQPGFFYSLQEMHRKEAVVGKKYSEILHHSVAGDLAVSRARLPSQSPLHLLPQTSWWKLFIDRIYHKEASPALLFDRQKSKGFYAVMMRVFKSELGIAQALHVPLDYEQYEKLYFAVSRDVGGIEYRGRSGSDAQGGATNFPPIYVPRGVALAELLAEGVYYWNLPAGVTHGNKAMAQVSLIYFGSPPSWRYSVGYTTTQGPILANAFFTRYYQELDVAGGPLAQLRAIVRLVRALHVYHFFRDGNGRLNTMVVLNKLLLENGFPPAIVSDPAIFGGGRSVAQLVDDVHNGMKIVLREMEVQLFMPGLDLAI